MLCPHFDAVKVFSATKQKERETLGETVTAWLQEHGAHITLVDKTVLQSSDNAYHCLSITLFYRRSPSAPGCEPSHD
jgi:hypothetical protein